MSDVGGIYANAASSHFVLIHRDGVLPYIPITRKQFFDRAVPYVTRYYDELIKKLQLGNDAMPAEFRVPKDEMDKQTALNTKAKNDALKKLHEAWDETAKDSLLGAAAVVRIDPLLMNEG